MKILFITPFFLPKIGGVEKHVFNLSKELIEMNNEITIITQKHQPNLESFEIINKIKVYRFNNNKLLHKWCWFINKNYIFKNYDAIHFHDVASFYWFIPLLPFNLDKIFITFHGFEGHIPYKKDIILRKIAELFTKKNICVGEFIKKWYGTKTKYVTYGAANTTYPKKPKYAIFIGRLADDTGIMEFLKIFKNISKHYYPELKLKICADGPLKNKVTKFIHDNDLNIELLGFVNNPEQYIPNSLFVFSSGYLGIMESMSSKKLVVAFYDSKIKKDYIKMTPYSKYIISGNSVSKITNELIEILKDKNKLKKKIENAYAYSKNQTWNKLARLYLKIYNIKKR